MLCPLCINFDGSCSVVTCLSLVELGEYLVFRIFPQYIEHSIPMLEIQSIGSVFHCLIVEAYFIF